LVAKENR
jgi:hypothetical protein